MVPGSSRHTGLIVFLMAMAILSGGTMIGGGDQMEDIQETISAASTAEAEEILEAGSGQDLIFAVFAEDAEQLNHAILLAESIRAFAGRYRNNPVWIFVPRGGIEISPDLEARMRELRVELGESSAPDEVLWFYYAAKVFAAAQAEEQVEERGGILAWLDEDTIVLQEPEAFALQPGRALAYRPVMHKNIGTLYAQPVDDFWARIYRKLSVPDEAPQDIARLIIQHVETRWRVRGSLVNDEQFTRRVRHAGDLVGHDVRARPGMWKGPNEFEGTWIILQDRDRAPAANQGSILGGGGGKGAGP